MAGGSLSGLDPLAPRSIFRKLFFLFTVGVTAAVYFFFLVLWIYPFPQAPRHRGGPVSNTWTAHDLYVLVEKAFARSFRFFFRPFQQSLSAQLPKCEPFFAVS